MVKWRRLFLPIGVLRTSQALSSTVVPSPLLAETKSGVGRRPEPSQQEIYFILSFNFLALLSIAGDEDNEVINPRHLLMNGPLSLSFLGNQSAPRPSLSPNAKKL